MKSKSEWFLFLIFFFIYTLFFHPVSDDNENSRYDLIFSLVELKTINIDQFEDNTQDKALFNGHYYSDKAIGTSFLGSLIYFPLHYFVHGFEVSRSFVQYIIRILVISIPSAAMVILLFRLITEFGLSQNKALVTVIFYGLGTSALPYSTVFHGHQLCGFFILVAYYIVLKDFKISSHVSSKKGFIFGILLGFACITEFDTILIVPLFIFLAVSKTRRFAWLVWFFPGFILPMFLQSAYNWMCFGSPLILAYSHHVLPHRGIGFMGLVYPSFKSLYGILFSPFRGLFFYSPFLIFFILGVVKVFCRPIRFELLIAFFCMLFYIFLNISLVDWEGGACAGPRYLVPVIPFMIILLSQSLQRMKPVSYFLYESLGWSSAGIFLLITATNINLPLISKFPLSEITRYLLRIGDSNLLTSVIWKNPTQFKILPLVLIVLFLFLYIRISADGRNKIFLNSVISCFSIGFFLVLLNIPFNKNSSSNHEYFGEHFSRQSKFELAENEFSFALQSNPHDWKSMYLLGELRRQQNCLNEAITLYKQTIGENKDYFAPYYRLGVIALNSENYEESVRLLEKALILSTGIPEIYNNLGIAYYGLLKYNDAEKMFRKAVELKPGYAQAWFNIGNLYLQYWKSPESIKYFEKALQIIPGFTPAKSQLDIAKKMFPK
ncbi:MAG: hypothetical protein A2161_22270 [Candidatus Schekmanbacteria bacterium RBG_13_48_7]|uniref:Uncharacterized protein n=1 Tax=Candidatus Schekmanbacteria bacterium RBG_13_48_7 TaxID=1817878 RepID=A0A1F7RZR7_9BACT|nr:MAG: hypothetical protein A2161_22270 [Candidatus Schekmanbacteria bacterium RBG_13_48_7]